MTYVNPDTIDFATPQEWVEYLKRPGTRKVQGQFASEIDRRKRCCLGHYCQLNGWKPDPEVGAFSPAIQRASITIGEELPSDHWLFQETSVIFTPNDAYEATTYSGVYEAAGRSDHQSNLVNINDNTRGFKDVIAYIEKYIIGDGDA